MVTHKVSMEDVNRTINHCHRPNIAYLTRWPPPKQSPSVGRGRSERGRGQANALVRGVIHRIETLKERVADDEVQPRSRLRPKVSDHQVDSARSAPNGRVQ